MKNQNEKQFDEKVEKAVEKYLNKKAQQQCQKTYFINNECVIDKLVEKEKVMISIANIFTELAKMTTTQMIQPIRDTIDQLEDDVQKVKELVIKSFNECSPLIKNINMTEQSNIETNNTFKTDDIERLRKKLQNHDNMISLLMDTQAQMKQNIQIFNNNDDIQQKLLQQFDDRIYNLKQELNDTKVADTVRQIKEKCNACWVVLGDVNERVEKIQKYVDEQIENKKSSGIFKKAASLIKSN